LPKLHSYNQLSTLKKLFLIPLFIIGCVSCLNAQLFISKLTGKGSSKYNTGYGAFLRLGFHISEADEITGEIGFNDYTLKDLPTYGILTAPLKVGYQYTIDRTGSGFYLEPQLGYNIVGIVPSYNNTTYQEEETKFKGVVGTINGGYIMNWESIGTKINFGLRYESVFYGGGSVHAAGMFLLFSFQKRKVL